MLQRMEAKIVSDNPDGVGRGRAVRTLMYLVLFLDANNYEFNMSLHSSLAADETALEVLMRRFVLKPDETLPPKATWFGLCDDCRESVHLIGSNVAASPPRKLA